MHHWTLHGIAAHAHEYETLPLIKDFDEKAHLVGVRACLIELQDFERSLDPRMPSGAEIVDAFIPQMLERCAKCDGIVLVAELDGDVAGFATILAKVESGEIEDGNIEYGLISDLIVAREFRERGIGRKLLNAAESYAKTHGVKWLRIGVLAENYAAERLYDSSGFEKLYIEREKELSWTD